MQDAPASLSPPPVPPSAPIAPTVRMESVTKTFGGNYALKGLSLEVLPGQITVLLGPNGAGKTTAIRMITGAMPPDEGLVQTFGLDPTREGESVRVRCGVVAAKPALYDRLPGWDNLMYSASLYGVTKNVEQRIRDAARRFDIESALDQYVGGYSTGMKTRLALARALLHNPDLLLLDEPTSGLDPESSHAVLALIRELTADGTTVVMCTHLLVEAEGLADQIVMLDDGIALLSGSQLDLIRRYWPASVVDIAVEDPIHLDTLRDLPGVTSFSRDRTARVELEGDHVIPDLVSHLVGTGARVTGVSPHQPTLEELYFRVRQEHRDRTGAATPAMAGAQS